MARAQGGKWSVGLCDCGNSASTCCFTFFLPCVTFGRNAEIVSEGQSSCCGAGCSYCILLYFHLHFIQGCLNRQQMRNKFGLPKEPCADCCVHFCCTLCALCQEHAELKNRGFDPAKGWVGQQTTAPLPPSMSK